MRNCASKKAFTFLELLVVGAIGLVLAAILFPVIAQAKGSANRAVTLGNYKQAGTAMILYASDNEERFPLAWSPDTTHGVWRSVAGSGRETGYLTSFPAGWRSGRYGGLRKREDSVMWANSILPYARVGEAYVAAGMPRFRSADPGVLADYAANSGRFYASSLTFNGLLHAYSMSAVAEPERHPMLWQGMFKRAYEGFARSNPELDCADLNRPCEFEPNDYPQGGSWPRTSPGYGYVWFGAANPYGSAWIYGRGMIFVQDDGAARYQQIGAPSMSLTATGAISRLGAVSSHQPFTRLDADPGQAPGTPFYSADCDGHFDGKAPYDDGVHKNVAYDCFFRPDSDYTYTEAQASDY